MQDNHNEPDDYFDSEDELLNEELLNNNKFGGNYNIPHIITQIKVFLKNGTGLGKY